MSVYGKVALLVFVDGNSQRQMSMTKGDGRVEYGVSMEQLLMVLSHNFFLMLPRVFIIGLRCLVPTLCCRGNIPQLPLHDKPTQTGMPSLFQI